ncbi:MAG: cellulase [Hyphomicrobiaceae bacterium]|nr:cellulase [Hyphomicrobiaceae bacterium]
MAVVAPLVCPGQAGIAASAAPQPGIRGHLPSRDFWAAYKTKFVMPEGRVVDDGNGGISHSEGQGYGMLLAVAADDRAAFDRIWGWTRTELMVRGDGLASWRWEPGKTPRITDRNNASDGDILIAWALDEAADAWGETAHKVAARALARAIGKSLIVSTPIGPMLTPALEGFDAKSRDDGPVVNLSYFVFPAFARMKALAAEHDWDGLTRGGLDLAQKARFGAKGLPTDWIALGGGKVAPAGGFAPTFSYNAVRVPLYLAWARAGQRGHLAPFAAAWEHAAPTVVDVTSGRSHEPLDAPGYRAIAALVRCSLDGDRLPDDLRGPGLDLYYPSTLKALAIVAVRQRYPECW